MAVARVLTPQELVFHCFSCLAPITDAYNGKIIDGLDDSIAPRFWLTECDHLICGKHLKNGGVPFHSAAEAPRAPCPTCIERNQDHIPKALYRICGFLAGGYDPAIPEKFFQFPPFDPTIDSSDQKAINFHYLSLLHYGAKASEMIQESQKREKQLYGTIEKQKKEREDLESAKKKLEAEINELEAESRRRQRFKELIPQICQELERLQAVQSENNLLKQKLRGFDRSLFQIDVHDSSREDSVNCRHQPPNPTAVTATSASRNLSDQINQEDKYGYVSNQQSNQRESRPSPAQASRDDWLKRHAPYPAQDRHQQRISIVMPVLPNESTKDVLMPSPRRLECSPPRRDINQLHGSMPHRRIDDIINREALVKRLNDLRHQNRKAEWNQNSQNSFEGLDTVNQESQGLYTDAIMEWERLRSLQTLIETFDGHEDQQPTNHHRLDSALNNTKSTRNSYSLSATSAARPSLQRAPFEDNLSFPTPITTSCNTGQKALPTRPQTHHPLPPIYKQPTQSTDERPQRSPFFTRPPLPPPQPQSFSRAIPQPDFTNHQLHSAQQVRGAAAAGMPPPQTPTARLLRPFATPMSASRHFNATPAVLRPSTTAIQSPFFNPRTNDTPAEFSKSLYRSSTASSSFGRPKRGMVAGTPVTTLSRDNDFLADMGIGKRRSVRR